MDTELEDDETRQLRAADAALRAGRFAEAVELASRLGDNQTALYLKAVAERYDGRVDAALATLDRLLGLYPDYARGLQERGHALRVAGRASEAIGAYEQAVQLNPALHASWKHLGALHQAAGDARAAARAQAQFDRLQALPAELVSVTSFIHEGKLLKAEKLCRAFLQRNRHHVEAMRLLAEIGMGLNILDDAEFLLESALALQPDYLPARIDYVQVLQKRQRFEKALDEARQVHAVQPDNPALALLHANLLAAVARYDEALALYDEILQAAPEMAHQVEMARGHSLRIVGRQEAAVAAYRSAATAKPGHGDAYWSLANLKTVLFSDDDLSEMRAHAGAPGTKAEDRWHLEFALGKAFEDRGDAEAAFHHYQTGNDLKKQAVRYSIERTEQEFALQKRFVTAEFLAERQGYGDPAGDPIFIVGLPRAGSTLIEQILAAHSQIDGTLELPNILALVRRINGRQNRDDDPRYPGNLAELGAERFAEFGRAFLEETRIHRQSAPLFTDKMPNNFRHIGLIHLILPNAKIIDARRAPMACCFSGFKQLFAEGQEFTYGLDEIGRYYRAYVDLMRHWDAVLPGKVLRVIHEDVVADLDGQVRRMLAFLEIPFEERCLRFHQAERAVRTASSEQVRRPIDTGGLAAWKPFEPFLEPLKTALGPALEDWRD